MSHQCEAKFEFELGDARETATERVKASVMECDVMWVAMVKVGKLFNSTGIKQSFFWLFVLSRQNQSNSIFD